MWQGLIANSTLNIRDTVMLFERVCSRLLLRIKKSEPNFTMMKIIFYELYILIIVALMCYILCIKIHLLRKIRKRLYAEILALF